MHRSSLTQQVCNITSLFDEEASRKKRRSAAQVIFEKANAAYDAAANWSMDEQWNARMSPKSCDDLFAKILTQGRAASNLSEQRGAELGEKLFLLEAYLSSRQALTIEIRDQWDQFVTRLLQPAEKKMIDSMSERVVLTIVTGGVAGNIEKMTKVANAGKKNFESLWYAMTCSKSKSRFGLSFVSDASCREPVGTITGCSVFKAARGRQHRVSG